MRLLIILFCLLNLTLRSEILIERVEELELVEILSVDTGEKPQRMDLSGLTTDGKTLYTVSDLSDQNEIYRIDLEEGKARLSVHRSFPETWLKDYMQRRAHEGRFDVEGISYCNGTFYLINEKSRGILGLDSDGKPFFFDLDFEALHHHNPFAYALPRTGIINAGLEGVACTPDESFLYVLNERQFRMGFSYDLKKRRLEEQWAIPAGSEMPRKEGHLWVYPDFAGAHHDGKLLHLLSRNRRQIVVVDPKNYKVLKRYGYGAYTKDLFEEKGVFGVAEGLTIFNGDYYIITDHNLWHHKGTDRQNPLLIRLRVYEEK